jgi:hypothetical protein
MCFDVYNNRKQSAQELNPIKAQTVSRLFIILTINIIIEVIDFNFLNLGKSIFT